MRRVSIGGRDFEVRPFTLKFARRLDGLVKVISSVGALPRDEHIDAILEIVHAAIGGAESKEWIEESLSFEQAPSVLKVILTPEGSDGNPPANP